MKLEENTIQSQFTNKYPEITITIVRFVINLMEILNQEVIQLQKILSQYCSTLYV
jgi:hypothetical protein